ncbi:MAG: PorP/SprF family type IX secretion system membrane protein [Bacteroidales bacterium]|nr:PorP/SprF family type IX secretion system membrane protein [Bacteroidales bacterium]
MIQVKYCLIILVLFCTLSSSGQGAMFSQFYATPLYTNPALAGSTVCGRFAVTYRNQWNNIFSSISASYDEHIDRLSGGLGLTVTNLREGGGAFSTTNVGIIYSYSFQLTEAFSVRTAVQAGFIHRSIDWNNLQFPDQFDLFGSTGLPTGENLPETPTSRFMEDFAVGIVGYSDLFYAGFAIHHLSTPDEGFMNTSRLPMKFTAHAGAVLDLRPTRGRFRDPNTPTISPNIIFQQQGVARQINYGVYVNNIVPMMVFGLWYRQTIAFNQPESITFLVGIRLNSLRIGYTYDLSINGLMGLSGGAHEFSMAYLLPCRTPRAPRIRAIRCPAF